MVNPKKKLRDYLSQGMRKLKHRKGYGVHSPFAYSIITEVIEEKLPYFAYRRMQRTYDKHSPIGFKQACLLFRLANRFRCRNIAVIGCQGGYSTLPLLLCDSRLKVHILSTSEARQHLLSNLSWIPQSLSQISFVEALTSLDTCSPFDFIIINQNPFEADADSQTAAIQLSEWIMCHSKEDTLIWVNGIQPRHRNEVVWDTICDRDDVSITMDLYDCGLSILRPRFFKQHYIVSF